MHGSPFTLRRNEIVQAQFPIDFLQSYVNGIVVQLCLSDTIGGDSRRQAWQVCLCFSPAASTFAGCIRVS